jgi:hypothetical protein
LNRGNLEAWQFRFYQRSRATGLGEHPTGTL